MKNEIIETNNRSNEIIFSAEKSRDLMAFADFMAKGSVMVPAHLQGKPADCMAVAIQSAAWGMSPFAVAQKTHLVNGQLGYEAQLVNAVVTSSRAVKGRFHYEYVGNWENWSCKMRNVAQQGQKPNWKPEYFNEDGLGVRVGAVLSGETEITWGEVIYLKNVRIRNSPLWQTNPKQQIAYLGVKYWSRLYCPEVLLGVYTPDEFYDDPEYDASRGTEKVINPDQQAAEKTVDDVFSGDTGETDTGNDTPGDIGVDDVFGEQSDDPTWVDLLVADINGCFDMREFSQIGMDIAKRAKEDEFSKDELLRVKTAFQAKKTELENMNDE